MLESVRDDELTALHVPVRLCPSVDVPVNQRGRVIARVVLVVTRAYMSLRLLTARHGDELRVGRTVASFADYWYVDA